MIKDSNGNFDYQAIELKTKEALAGIPGYFGGAVSMNAGSFGMELKDVLSYNFV